jgi:rhodanese-related sulfurtransferase
MKKLGLIALLSVLTIGVVACGNPNSSSEAKPSEQPSSQQPSSEQPSSEPSSEETATLPAAWGEGVTSWAAKDCSVHLMPAEGSSQKSVKEFLYYPGARFIDLRDETEGYSEGHVQRFESISYFRLIEKLFTPNSSKTEVTRAYEDAEYYLNAMFPKDTPIFLMCAAGGRVVYMMNLLNQYKYDMSKIYNVGGWDSITAAEQAGTNPYQITEGFGAEKTNAYKITIKAVEA